MTRRQLTNVWLLVAVTALAIHLYRDTPPPAGPDLLTNIRPDSIRHIAILGPDRKVLGFERSGGRWLLDGVIPANPDRIRSMLRLLNEISTSRLPVAGLDLGKLKLDPPALTLMLDRHAFEFGDVSALDKRRYVRHRETVHLLPDHLLVQLQQNREFFVDRRLLAWQGHLIRITYPAQRFHSDGGAWHAEPAADWTPERIGDRIAAWETAQALSVVAADPTQAGDTIMLENDRGESIHFQLIRAGHEAQLARPELGLRYEIDTTTAKRLGLVDETPPPVTAPASGV